MSRYAVIDIGTNSLKLLVAKIASKGGIKPISERVIITRLGQGLDKSRQLSQNSIKRTLAVIKRLIRIARRAKVDSIDLLATSAVREARNAPSFIRYIRQKTGLNVRVLSSQEESTLSYLGATVHTNQRSQQNNLVVDIGGGSTELSYTSSGKFYSKHFPLGAVKLTERFIHSDPISATDYKTMTAFILKHLKPARPARNLKKFIGVGGTIVTLAGIDLGLKQLTPHRIHDHKMSYKTIDTSLDYFKTTTLREKKKLWPVLEGPARLPVGRADIILAGTAILVNLMKLYRMRTIRTSTAGLRQGWLISRKGRRMSCHYIGPRSKTPR